MTPRARRNRTGTPSLPQQENLSPELLQQLRKVAVIMSNDRREGEADTSAEINTAHGGRLLEPALTRRNGSLWNRCSTKVDLLVTYSNRFDLREQLQQVVVILSEEASQDNGPDSSADGEVRSATRWWSLRDRFSSEDLQLMIDLYRSGKTAKQVAEEFGVSERSVIRLLRQYGVRREGRDCHS